MDEGSDWFFPYISKFGPWSGETLKKGKPIVILIASNLYNVFKGVKTWSWYMPTTTSNLSIFLLIKKVSAEKGPCKFNFLFFSKFIAGIMCSSSSPLFSIVSQCGFKPKIAILGLNPHNAELKKYSEERKIIIPAILKLNRFGLNVKGPMIADTFFINDYKKFDIIIGMYHDQVLVPFKTLFKFDGINITLGLKYLRASPDHGVATNLIGKKKANPHSLLECINFLNKFGKWSFQKNL